MVDPYKAKISGKVVFTEKSVVVAKVVAVLKGTIENRGLELIHPASRAMRKGEIFELMVTPEKDAGPGKRVDAVTYLGFAEVEVGGVLRVNDIVKTGSKIIGTIVGFDETHFPNHQNVVLKPAKGIDEKEIELQLGSILEFMLPNAK